MQDITDNHEGEKEAVAIAGYFNHLQKLIPATLSELGKILRHILNISKHTFAMRESSPRSGRHADLKCFC